MRRVIVIGGRGWFGHLIVEQLAKRGIEVLIASRGGNSALHIDVENAASIRAAVRPQDLVIDAAGPYHSRSMALIDAAVQTGFDVIDINDDLGYAQKVLAAEDRIRATGIRVLSSASTVSALSAAVVQQSGIANPLRVNSILAPASRYTANIGTALSLLRSVGGPIQVWRDGRLQAVTGWSEPHEFTLPLFQQSLTGRLFETADSIYLPRRWPSLGEVTCRVDANIPAVNGLLRLAARSRIVRATLQQLTPIGTGVAKRLGSAVGGVGYEIEGADGEISQYALVSESASYLAAVVPVVLAACDIVGGRCDRVGLVPPDEHTEPGELFACLAELGIHLTPFTAYR